MLHLSPPIGMLLCVVVAVLSNSLETLTIAHQAPLSMGFPRQEYWSELPFPSPEYLPGPGLNPSLLHWQDDLYHWATWKAPVLPKLVNKPPCCFTTFVSIEWLSLIFLPLVHHACWVVTHCILFFFSPRGNHSLCGCRFCVWERWGLHLLTLPSWTASPSL